MRRQDASLSDRTFWRLALTTAFLTAGLIVFGAIVRVTDSGLGCGDHWPLCNGTVFPPLDNLTAWIEWSHRLFALLIGALGIAMLVVAVRNYRRHNRAALGATALAAVLFAVQSGLGAVVVKLELPPTMITLHLGTAMLLLGSLLAAAILAYYRPREHYARDSVTMLVYVTTALALVIILTGALVRGRGATLACVDWPLCNGEIFPFGQGELPTIHMIHRLAVAALGAALVMLVWQALRNRRNGPVRILAALALAAFLAQAGIGALFVLSGAAPGWGAAHVGIAATAWALLVALSVIETMNTRSVSEAMQDTEEWTPQSEAFTR